MKKFIILSFLAIGLVSCDFLDVVPEGTATFDDLFSSQTQCDKYVCTMYSASYTPERGFYDHYVDVAGADLVTHAAGPSTSWLFKSTYYDNIESPSTSYIGVWDNNGQRNYYVWMGIRVAYDVINNCDKVPDATSDQKSMWKGEAYCMIAYLHLALLELYGPIPLIDHELSLNEDYSQARQPYVDCVQFISDMCDRAYSYLPDHQETRYYGRCTKAAALSLKVRAWTYAASPWINGNSEWYGNLRNHDGTNLIPQTYDPELWKKVMDAADEAIQYCEANGFTLYESGDEGSSDFERGYNSYRATFNGEKGASTFFNEQEFLMVSYTQASDWVYNCRYATPRVGYSTYTSNGFRGSVNPTFNAVEMYWSQNGLPMDVDPLTKDLDLYSIAPGDSTVLLHRYREPRFYAAIGYDRGEYDVNGGTIILKCRRGEEQQNDGDVSHEYQTSTGYYTKKFTSTTDSYNVASNTVSPKHAAYPYLRVAENYLSYAEAEAEYTGTLSAKGLEYINKVRHRAGIPNIEDSWALVGGLPSGQDLVDVIRQERLIEFEFEGRWYHDLRRWKMAEEFYKPEGGERAWNLAGTTAETFYQVSNMYEGTNVRTFETPKNYWLAVPQSQININPLLVQNTGYNGAD